MVVPATMTFKMQAKQVRQSGAVFTVAPRRVAHCCLGVDERHFSLTTCAAGKSSFRETRSRRAHNPTPLRLVRDVMLEFDDIQHITLTRKRGGAYIFLPDLKALRYLANLNDGR